MRRKYLLASFVVIIILTAFVINSLILRFNITKDYLSPAEDKTYQIDLLDLRQSDFQYINKDRFNRVFLTKGYNQKQVFYNERPLLMVALSPSQGQLAFFYSLEDHSMGELKLIILETETGKRREIARNQFSLPDVSSNLHWLGDNHIFFLRHCGTACQGIVLLDVRSGLTKNAVLSYPPFPDLPEETHFKDWFGQEFVMDGLVGEVSSETKEGVHYLVFILRDYQDNFLAEKRFQFTETEINEL